ncbi:hypothetical protein BI364_09595 [Acidihalobacter yilgarnensis]|uniref:Xcc1710-like domain-containing protein n=1 Tax=Acidihalobacter yilgarnensis TaxID=2819280 RepID=A0A1D8INW3_9GAMM|nr:Mth938-like domain-containing protein [Acidihalobacter yilgarnensis]AOU98173.1 hypothetical protein BI364_09595 [Acidihalobacter yilgarnensis]
MRFTEDTADASYVIDAYGPGWVSINHVAYTHSVIVMPDQLHTPWRPTHLTEFTADDLGKILAMTPEIILVGTGRHQRFPETDILKQLAAESIGCEFMDTAAACRTYTVLMAEKRRVAAALLMAD